MKRRGFTSCTVTGDRIRGRIDSNLHLTEKDVDFSQGKLCPRFAGDYNHALHSAALRSRELLHMLPREHFCPSTGCKFMEGLYGTYGPQKLQMDAASADGYAYTRTPTPAPQNNVDYPSFVWQTTDGASSREIITCNLSFG